MSLTNNLSRTAFRLEKQMVSPNDWSAKVPQHILDMFREDIESGYPIGFAYDKRLGWCMIFSGQGPCIGWCEHEELLDEEQG
jgi:hypothetical protein